MKTFKKLLKKALLAYEYSADKAWVIQAYLRGKVLNQQAYIPKHQKTTGFCLLVLPEPTSNQRSLTLLTWWGFKPAANPFA